MLVKYDYISFFFTKDQNMQSVLLSFVHLHSASLKLSRCEKDWSLVSHSVKVYMDCRISSKMFDLEMLES